MPWRPRIKLVMNRKEIIGRKHRLTQSESVPAMINRWTDLEVSLTVTLSYARILVSSICFWSLTLSHKTSFNWLGQSAAAPQLAALHPPRPLSYPYIVFCLPSVSLLFLLSCFHGSSLERFLENIHWSRRPLQDLSICPWSKSESLALCMLGTCPIFSTRLKPIFLFLQGLLLHVVPLTASFILSVCALLVSNITRV